MAQGIGYIGKIDGHSVYYNGDFYYAIIAGRNIVIDFDRISDRRKQIAY